MDGMQTLVAAGAFGLVGVNFWTGDQRQRIGGVLWTGANPADAHRALLELGGELLLVAVLIILAGLSDTMAKGMAAIVAALWILWAIGYYSPGARTAAARSAPGAHIE